MANTCVADREKKQFQLYPGRCQDRIGSTSWNHAGKKWISLGTYSVFLWNPPVSFCYQETRQSFQTENDTNCVCVAFTSGYQKETVAIQRNTL